MSSEVGVLIKKDKKKEKETLSRQNTMNSTEVGNCTTIQEPKGTTSNNYFSTEYSPFHRCFNGECFDFCCSSKRFFPSSAIKTSRWLPHEHRFLRGPNFTSSFCDLYFRSRTFQTLLLYCHIFKYNRLHFLWPGCRC